MVHSRRSSRIAAGEVHVVFWPTAFGSEGMVRTLLAEYVGCVPWRLEIDRAASRPALGAAMGSDLSFNLSHSHDQRVLALARDVRVGVDVEWLRGGLRVDALVRRFFAASEADAIAALPKSDRTAAFFRTWVRKEAYLKAVNAGVGVPAGLRRFVVSVTPDHPAIESTTLEPRGVSSFCLYDLDVPDGYVGALAVEGTGHRIRYFDRSHVKGEGGQG